MNRKRRNRLLNLILGGIEREYTVLNPSDKIQVSSRTYTARKLASLYQPIIRQDRKLSGPVPYALKYEVVPRNHQIVLVYHVCWKDEIHPNPIINLFYRSFRTMYYGSSIDSESIEMWIDRVIGSISNINFETERGGNPNVFLPSHTPMKISMRPNGTYVQETRRKKHEVVSPIFSENHLELKVLTWNHQFKLHDGDNTPAHMPQLSFLADHEFITERYVRRRTHIYVTHENVYFLLTSIALEVVMIALFSSLINQILNWFKGFTHR